MFFVLTNREGMMLSLAVESRRCRDLNHILPFPVHRGFTTPLTARELKETLKACRLVFGRNACKVGRAYCSLHRGDCSSISLPTYFGMPLPSLDLPNHS